MFTSTKYVNMYINLTKRSITGDLRKQRGATIIQICYGALSKRFAFIHALYDAHSVHIWNHFMQFLDSEIQVFDAMF